MTKIFYRVSNHETQQGLWYAQDGNFTGLIHNELSFCKNSELKMDFDETLCGWLSAATSMEDLYNWFSHEDILSLQKHGFFIHEFEAVDYWFYDRFQHFVINQATSKVVKQIIL